jgi:hypothetical protein
MTNEAVREIVEDWNGFIFALTDARAMWNKLQIFMDNNPVHGDNLPPKIQKLLSMHRRMQFTVAIVELADHWRAYGGLDSFFVDLPEDEAVREKYRNLIKKVKRGNGDA